MRTTRTTDRSEDRGQDGGDRLRPVTQMMMPDTPLARLHRDIMASPALNARAVDPKASSRLDSLAQSATLQAKMKACDDASVFDGANPPPGVANMRPLDYMLNEPQLHVVKSVADFVGLSEGDETDVLRPKRYLIGERHDASAFATIKGQWPGIATMVETNADIIEKGLDLGEANAELTQSFEGTMQSKGKGDLPLENFHAAAATRCMLGLWLVNDLLKATDKDAGKPKLETDLLDLSPMLDETFATYFHVSMSVRTHKLSPFSRYKSDVEREYGSFYGYVSTDEALAGKGNLEIMRRTTVGAPFPKVDLASVRSLLFNMAKFAHTVLTLTAKSRPDDKLVAANATAAMDHVAKDPKNEKGTLSEDTVLKLGNPNREIFMREQIRKLPRPALVKVGAAHVPSLESMADDIVGCESANEFRDLIKMTLFVDDLGDVDVEPVETKDAAI